MGGMARACRGRQQASVEPPPGGRAPCPPLPTQPGTGHGGPLENGLIRRNSQNSSGTETHPYLGLQHVTPPHPPPGLRPRAHVHQISPQVFGVKKTPGQEATTAEEATTGRKTMVSLGQHPEGGGAGHTAAEGICPTPPLEAIDWYLTSGKPLWEGVGQKWQTVAHTCGRLLFFSLKTWPKSIELAPFLAEWPE